MERSVLKMPAVALRGMTILPGMITHFDVSRSRSAKAVERSVAQDQKLFVVTQKDPETENPNKDGLFSIGTIVEVKQIIKMPHNILRILVEGAGRAELCGLEDGEYLEADVCEIPDIVEEGLPEEAMLRNLQDIFEGYTAASGKMNKDMARQIENCQTVQNMMEQISIHVPFRWEEHQQYLETVNFEERYELLCVLLNNEIEIEKFRRGIQEKVKARVDKQQKDYILREQLKVIREELGDDGPNTEAAAFREEVKKLEASEEVKERIEKEIQRFLNSGANSAEAGVIRGYIETLLALPWDKRSEDRLDLRKAEEILEEVKYLVSKGVKEFQVIAQELTYYGVDLYKKQMLPELIECISDIPGVEWIRLHYAYPAHFPTDLFRVMRERDNVCKYMDIALQHISDNMLERMRRHVTKEDTYRLIEQFRREVPGIHLRTTLMVGHPGETEVDFEELKEFVRKVRFDRMGAFTYSEEEGTYAAKHYEDSVPAEIKQARLDELMDIQQGISAELSAAKVGKQMRVIIDRVEGDYYIGRTEFDSPEVDPEVLIDRLDGTPLIIGNFYQIEVVDSDDFDLFGKVV